MNQIDYFINFNLSRNTIGMLLSAICGTMILLDLAPIFAQIDSASFQSKKEVIQNIATAHEMYKKQLLNHVTPYRGKLLRVQEMPSRRIEEETVFDVSKQYEKAVMTVYPPPLGNSSDPRVLLNIRNPQYYARLRLIAEGKYSLEHVEKRSNHTLFSTRFLTPFKNPMVFLADTLPTIEQGERTI